MLAVGTTISAYLLTLAVVMPLSGWISRRFGARRVFLTAIVVFTVASLLCAGSTSLTELTAFRVVQGVGGALMVPVGRLVVLRTTEQRDTIRAIALLTWPALAAPVIAPLLGGLLVTYTTWHWIFLINAPLGVVAFIAALRLMPKEQPEAPPRLDWAGAVLVGVGLGLLVYGSSLLTGAEVGDHSASMSAAIWAAIGAVVLTLSVRHLLRTKNPLLSLRMFSIPTLRLSNASGSVFRMTISAVPFLLPLMFQVAFGASPVFSGAMVLFLFAGNLLIKPATTPLLRRFGFRTIIVAAAAGASASMVLAALLTPSTPVPLIIAVMLFSGIVRSIGFTAYNTLAFAEVEPGRMVEANTVASTFQQVAAGFGVALGALALRLGDIVSGAPAGSASAAPAFQLAFVALAVVTLVPVVGALSAHRAVGDTLRPQQATR